MLILISKHYGNHRLPGIPRAAHRLEFYSPRFILTHFKNNRKIQKTAFHVSGITAKHQENIPEAALDALKIFFLNIIKTGRENTGLG